MYDEPATSDPPDLIAQLVAIASLIAKDLPAISPKAEAVAHASPPHPDPAPVHAKNIFTKAASAGLSEAHPASATIAEGSAAAGRTAAGLNSGIAAFMLYRFVHEMNSGERSQQTALRKGAMTIDLLNASITVGKALPVFGNAAEALAALKFLRGGGTVLCVASTGLLVWDDLKRKDYEAAKRDGTVGIAGIVGGMGSGALVGAMGGGPVGAFFGGVAGGIGAATGTNLLLDMMKEDPARAMQLVQWQGDFMRGLTSGDPRKAEQAKAEYIAHKTGQKPPAGGDVLKQLSFKDPAIEGVEVIFRQAQSRGFKPLSVEEMLAHSGDAYKAYKMLLKSGEFGNALAVYGEYTGHLLELASHGLNQYDAKHVEGLYAQATHDLETAFPADYKRLVDSLAAQQAYGVKTAVSPNSQPKV
jgi:hypothetical protein